MDKISICIPTYNQPEALKRCLDSILNQTISPYEIIISDDSSDDAVKFLVKKYLHLYPIQYYQNIPSKGTPENWNCAIKRAKGNYILLLHHDDWFYTKNCLEVLGNKVSETSVEFVFVKSYAIKTQNIIVSKNNPSEKVIRYINKNPRCLFYRNWIGAPSAVLFKNKNIFFNTSLIWLVDIEFYIRYIDKNKICYVDEAIVGTAISDNQVTNYCVGNPEIEIKENLIVYANLQKSLKYYCHDFMHFLKLFYRLNLKINDIKKFNFPCIVKIFYYLSMPLLIIKNFNLLHNKPKL